MYIYERQLSGSQDQLRNRRAPLWLAGRRYYLSPPVVSRFLRKKSGDAAVVIDVDRAVSLNRRYARSLGWQTHFDRIVRLLGFTTFTPNERIFAEAVARWQRRQGLSADGILGSKAWSRMRTALGIARPSAASEVNTLLPAAGPGYYTYSPPAERFGLPETIRAVQAIAAAWYQRHPEGPRLGIGDISVRSGGPISGHEAHRLGREVDIRPVRIRGMEGPENYLSPTYSQALTQELVNLIGANGVLRVRTILFNDPNIRGVSWYKGHNNHLHVGFHPSARRTQRV